MGLAKIFDRSNKNVSAAKIIDAIQAKNTKKALKLIPLCKDLDSDANSRATPIECSIIEKNLTVLDALLEAGASANTPTFIFNLKPLQQALNSGFFDAAISLVNHGANLKDSYYNYSVLNSAIAMTSFTSSPKTFDKEKTCLKLISTLVEKGADVNKEDKIGATPLVLVANCLSDEAYLIKVADILIKGGAKLTDRVLHDAKENGKELLAQEMHRSIVAVAKNQKIKPN